MAAVQGTAPSSGGKSSEFAGQPRLGIGEKHQEATAYVGNLDDRVNDALLWELFVQVGPVVSVHIPRDRINQTHMGYGFVEFQTEGEAEYASKVMHGIKLYGKPLRVNRSGADRRHLDVGANLFIGNLDMQVDELLLGETFKAFGTVLQAKVAREGEAGSGASRGFGFINFDSFEAADAAIEAMNGQYLCNRPITACYAFKKDSKGERHGTAAERLLAAQAKRTGLIAAAPMAPGGHRPPAGNTPMQMPAQMQPHMQMPPQMQMPAYMQMQAPMHYPPNAPMPFPYSPNMDPNYAAAMQQMMMAHQQYYQQQQQQQQPLPPPQQQQYPPQFSAVPGQYSHAPFPYPPPPSQ